MRKIKSACITSMHKMPPNPCSSSQDKEPLLFLEAYCRTCAPYYDVGIKESLRSCLVQGH